MKILLKQLIIPRIEYGCVLWSPTSLDQIKHLESVQKFFTGKISFKNNNKMDYWERLQDLKLFSVERRRERYIILYTWKVIHNMYPNPGLQLNKIFPNSHTQNPANGITVTSFNDRTGMKIGHIPTKQRNLKSLSVLNKCCDLYNCLPSQLRRPISADAEPNYPQFKTELDKWLATIPDQPSIPGRHRPSKSNSINHQKYYRR